nr:DUF1659 domain-containing protein [uncultured Bacillus sp.]
MAETIISSSKLLISYETGMNSEGKPIYKTKTYSNVKEEATADGLLETAQALASLSAFPMHNVKRNDVSDLV